MAGAPHRVLPPIYLLVSLLVMTVAHALAPGPRVILPPWSYAGGGLVLAGLVLNAVSAGLFAHHHTAIKPFQESTALVTRGPFRYSRNPMYLGMLLVLMGVGVLFGTVTPFLVLPFFAIAMTRIFISAEERSLAERFGRVYLDYQHKVRRWL